MSRWLLTRAALDRLAALVLAVLTAPIVAVAGMLVKREDGGPAFVRVTRMGRGGRRFGMWKLRSMRADSPDGRAAGSALTNVDDERITQVGARLRAYHLDELPQLINVVRGEMTLFGPRPEAPEFVDLDDPAWQAVLRVPPGIAGPTQVIINDWERLLIAADPAGAHYRDKVLPVKLAIDQWYLEKSSPAIDLLVFVTLVRRFVPGAGSWTLKHRIEEDVPEARHVVDALRE